MRSILLPNACSRRSENKLQQQTGDNRRSLICFPSVPQFMHAKRVSLVIPSILFCFIRLSSGPKCHVLGADALHALEVLCAVYETSLGV